MVDPSKIVEKSKDINMDQGFTFQPMHPYFLTKQHDQLCETDYTNGH
nr:1160_t:CDS:2 [Entrophospora candida]